MNNFSLQELIAHCSKDDPLNEFWLWAQAAGIAIAVALAGSVLLTISNCFVISYTAVMSRLCATDFSLSWFSAWQDTVSSMSVLLGMVLAVVGIFIKLSLQTRYGSAVVKRNMQVALGLEEAVKLCQSAAPGRVSIQREMPLAGQTTMHMTLDQNQFATSYLLIRAIPTSNVETTILIDAVPVMRGQWGLLSALFCDYGANKTEVREMMAELSPYMSNKRRAEAQAHRKSSKRKVITREQVLREAPPMLIKNRAY